MKKFLNAIWVFALALGICLALAACGGHECTDADKNHKCDTCEAPMGEHADGDDEDHLCDYGCGWHECTDADKNHKCDTCETAMGEHTDGDDGDHLCDYGCGEAIDADCYGIADGVCDGCGKTFLTKEVFVSVSNKGTLVLAREKILAVDKNEDGKTNIDEVLSAAHEAKYQGGAAAGYGSYMHEQFGMSLGTLWGDTSGAFGYYKNDASAWSLLDEVKDGDHVYAYVYADAEYFSDSYAFFNVTTASVAESGEIELTLNGAGYDESWNPVTLPVAGATITIDGVETDYVTDTEGKVTICLDEAGVFVISAKSATATLVPPVCVITVGAAQAD